VDTILRVRLAAVPKSLPAARHAVLAVLDHAAVGDAVDRSSVALAVSEAFANAVRHAYVDPASSEVDVTVVTDEHGITITVADSGIGFERARAGGGHGLGLGLKLIDQLATTSTIDSTPDGTSVTMRFACPAPTM
jgi:serine/threonine-protein kinase RsbW